MIRQLRQVLFLATVSGAALIACVSLTYAQTGEWTCNAENMKSGSYNGGKTAKIHLKPYKKGAAYPVTIVSDDKVTGVTKDGTPFTCIRS